jgi:DNA-binding response OmpR family regulator
LRVLVVDDSKDMTDAITLYCDTEKDLDCHVINDGQEALERIRKEKFDLILLDLSIPEFSGLDVGRLSSSDFDYTRMYTFTYRVRTPQYSFMVPKIKVASAI